MCGSWWSQWTAFQRCWWKFNRLLKAGKVPAQIKEIWEKSETTEEKTMSVDCLLQEELQDRLLGNAGRQSQFQKLAEETSDKSFGKDAQTSFPRAIMPITTSMAMLMPSTRRWPVVTSQGSTKERKWCTGLIPTKVEGPKLQTKELRNMCVIFVRDIGEYPVKTEGQWYK